MGVAKKVLIESCEVLQKGFEIVERTARVGLDLSSASEEEKAKWFYIWCGDIAGELGEVSKLRDRPANDPQLLSEVGDVLWGVSAVAMICEITPSDIYSVNIASHEQCHYLVDCILDSLDLLEHGKKVCRDGLSARPLDRAFVLRQLALIFDWIESHYNINSAFEAVNQKLLLRYPNGYTPKGSVNRVV